MPDGVSLMVFAAWFVGGFISGVTGVGGSLVALPLTALALPMHTIIPLSCILNTLMDAALVALHFRHCKLAALIPLMLGALPGSVLGLYILQVMSGDFLQGALGVVLLGYIWWQLTARGGVAREDSWLKGSVAGFGAGVLGTAISIDGPPVGAYALHVGWPPRMLLGTLGVFFVLRGLFTCVLQGWAGLYTAEVIHHTCYGAPACVLGTVCALPVVKRIPMPLFRKALMLVIAAAGVVCLVGVLRGGQ